jgi:short-subunit dehydrogenase
MTYWQGKRAVVTGGSAGLGRAIAERLLGEGARVAIVARHQDALDETAGQLAARGGDVLPIAADVTDQADTERLAATVSNRWGGVDLFCANAGRSMRGHALTTPIDKYRELWELNFLAAVRGVQTFAESLVTNRGHVVLVSSLAGKISPRYLGAYPTSKFPLAALAQQLRMELEPRGVHTLLVCPGPVAGAHAGIRYADEAPDVPAAARQPAGGARLKVIQPADLAGRILRACERRRAELIVPGKVRLLLALSQLWPRLGDRVLRKNTPSE